MTKLAGTEDVTASGREGVGFKEEMGHVVEGEGGVRHAQGEEAPHRQDIPEITCLPRMWVQINFLRLIAGFE